MSSTTDRYEDEGSGWVTFAGVMILMLAVLNVIRGIAAISDSKFWVGDQKYVIHDLHTWGWVILIIGIIEIFVAFGIWSGGSWSRWIGVFIATLNAIWALFFIPAAPFWALTLFAIAIFVIYGLAAHGGRGRASTG